MQKFQCKKIGVKKVKKFCKKMQKFQCKKIGVKMHENW